MRVKVIYISDPRIVGFLKAAALAVFLAAGVSEAGHAAPIITDDSVSFAGGSVSFGFGGGAATYTLSSTGDIFNPVAVATGGTALVSAFGGFLGIPIQPTTYFIDRGSVVFGSAGQYAAFPTATTIPYSNGANFVGLAFMLPDGTHYGFVEFVDTTLAGYGYESTPGASITAVSLPSSVPEPAGMALFAVGLLGLAVRHRLS